MKTLLVGIVVLLGVLVVACGPGSANTGASATSTTVTVNVMLSDFKVESPVTTFNKGQTYRFIVSNKGTVNHEFVIEKIGEQHNMQHDMPGMNTPMAGMSTPASDMSGMDTAIAAISQDQLPSGATKTIDVIFKDIARAGELEIACHVPGHYEAGMKLPIMVN